MRSTPLARAARKAADLDPSPWPAEGFITSAQLRAALGGVTRNTLTTWVADGVVPPLVAIGYDRVGLPVALAREVVATFPQRVAERAAARAAQRRQHTHRAREVLAARRQRDFADLA